MVEKSILNTSRALYYFLLSKFFILHNSSEKDFSSAMNVMEILIKNPLEENTKKSLENLYEIISSKKEKLIIQEHDEIFFLPGSRTVKTTASYYDDGVETGGRKLVEVKNFLSKTKIRRNEKVYKEPEDSIGFLFVFMNELIELIRAGQDEYDNLQHCIFTEILNPFVDTFIHELYNHQKSDIYKDVTVVLNAFMEFERFYFDVEKPNIINISNRPKFSRSKEEEISKNRARKKADKLTK